MSDTSSIPSLVVTAAGATPTPPATLRARLIALVAGQRPGYTANLPGSLIEDVSSTSVGALTEIDQGIVELLNSLTAAGANPFLLAQLGEMLGVEQGGPSNTSVFVTFSGPAPGYVISKGFVIGDGAFQYVVQDGGVIESDGLSAPLFALANQPGSWAVPAGTVTQIVTSVPSNVTLSVVNPEPGTPGLATAERESSYRSRVIDANLAASQGMARYLKTILSEVSGVQPRLISVRSPATGEWEVIVGGGDPYAVAAAIWEALFDISSLVGSILDVTGATNANPGVVTVNLNHGYVAGQAIAIAGASPSGFDGSFVVLSTPTQTTFGLGKAFASQNLTALSWAATGGGEITATTAAVHNVTVGSTFVLSGCAPTGYNGTYVAIAGTTGSTLVAALVSNPGAETTLGQLLAGTANVDSTSFGAYVSGGVVTPNLRNVSVDLVDWPDTYVIPYVNPPQQTVTMAVTWNTTATNVVSAAAVAQLAVPALVAYVNAISVGQPINLFELQAAFQASIASVVPAALLTRMVFAVSINGVGVSPESGTGIIAGDPESFFFAQASGMTVTQG